MIAWTNANGSSNFQPGELVQHGLGKFYILYDGGTKILSGQPEGDSYHPKDTPGIPGSMELGIVDGDEFVLSYIHKGAQFVRLYLLKQNLPNEAWK